MLEMKRVKLCLEKFLCSEMQRYRLAQILFILSIAFGWYIDDGYRRCLFVISILLLSREQRRICVRCNWSGLQKIAGYLLLILFVWVILAPLLGGVGHISERIHSVARPLEIFLYCIGVMIFARDAFFDKYFDRLSIISAIFLFVFVFIHRLLLSFSTERNDWIFNKHAAFAGLILVSILPWLVCGIIDNKNNKYLRIICIVIFPVALITIFVTYYRTIWLAMVVQLLCVIPLGYYMFRMKLYRIVKVIVLFVLSFTVLILLSCNANIEVRNEIKDNIKSSLAITSNFERFTNHRGEIWEEAMTLINQRKLCGYGWIDYNDYALIKQHHPHSSYLQAAFHAGIPAMVLYIAVLFVFEVLACKYIIRDKTTVRSVYVVALMIISTMVVGLTESFFFTSREYLIPFWSMLAILVSPRDFKR